MALTRPAHYRVDIHSSNGEFEELTQVRLYDPTRDERATAALFGLAAIIERPSNPVHTSTIGHAWSRCGGENFVLQAGLGGNLQPVHCERLFRALVAFLVRTEILSGVELAEEEEGIHYFGVKRTFPLISSISGLFVSRAEVGHWLTAGDVIGSIYDGFRGEMRAEIRSPVSGQLSGIRRQPLLCEGDLLARIQTTTDLGAMADTYLQGHGQ